MRVLLKISGEALSGIEHSGLDFQILDDVGEMIKELVRHNIEVGIVVGAGNFIRGAEIEKLNIDRCNADNMGMLATNINVIALSDVLIKKEVSTKIVNSFSIEGVIERFNKTKVVKDLSKGKVVIFGGGTGNPYFTTDTAGVLRALEIEANLMIKATKVDGVYDKDPMKFHDAELLKELTYDEVLENNLGVMDYTAISLSKSNRLKLMVCNLAEPGAILNCILTGKGGTTIN
ncbi:MAG: UMP kinase [Candidatus Gracilibacteria bacterium]